MSSNLPYFDEKEELDFFLRISLNIRINLFKVRINLVDNWIAFNFQSKMERDQTSSLLYSSLERLVFPSGTDGIYDPLIDLFRKKKPIQC